MGQVWFVSTVIILRTTRLPARFYFGSCRFQSQCRPFTLCSPTLVQATVDGNAAYERAIRWNNFQNDAVGTQVQSRYSALVVSLTIYACNACRVAQTAALVPTLSRNAAI
jgi:hypothetical protein